MNARHLSLLAAATALLGAAPADQASAACSFTQTELPIGASGTPIAHVRIAERADGRPVLMVSDDVQNQETLWVYSCANRLCTSGQASQVVTSTNFFERSGIVVRNDGRPALVGSYRGGLRYFDCVDADCTSVNWVEIWPNATGIFSANPMVLQANGAPAFLYIDSTLGARPGHLIYHACDDDSCESGSEKTLAVPPDSTSQIFAPSLAIDANGHPAASYLVTHGASTSADYLIARCTDSACDAITHTTLAVPSSISNPTRTDLVIRGDGRPLALDSQGGHRALLDCNDVSCSSATDRMLPPEAPGDLLFGLDLTSDGRAAFGSFFPNWMNAWTCADANCASGTLDQVSTPATVLVEADHLRAADGSQFLAWIPWGSTLNFAACLADPIFADGFD